MLPLDVGALIEKVPVKLKLVQHLCADTVSVKDRPMWRIRFMPTRTREGDTSLWGFAVDAFWEPVMEPPMLQLSTQDAMHLHASARRWLEGKVRVHRDQAAAPLRVLVHEDESLSVYSRQVIELTSEDIQVLSARTPPAQALMAFHYMYRDKIDLLFNAWTEARRIGCEYRTLN